MNDKLVLTTISGLLTVCRGYEDRLARLETALKTLLAQRTDGWEETAEAVRADLRSYDADSSTSDRTDRLDVAIESIRAESSKQGQP